ncbi:hypothetical protein E6C70_04615 [Glaciibacter flavus]|uniref:Uncharacterized protein n=1 Tax=Orlajensenia flava TaxID=2565934 RepID=A0A4S4FZ58_9MICO|nr:hypothetical protein [Glaciibacter flavus]THG35345.1 hypothetical protein E6C70_04615 [Glaciibacter flavus]
MAFTLMYDQLEYEISDGDASRLEDLDQGRMPFGPRIFSFDQRGVPGTVLISVGTGIPITLVTNDD